MALEIENIRLNKEKYIFGEDKEVKVSFDLYAKEKEGKLNSVNIEYGVIISAEGEDKYEKNQTIQLLGTSVLQANETRTLECLIPIVYPNIKEIPNNESHEGGHSYNNKAELKNYIRIIADINFNLNDCSKEIFPQVEYKKNHIPSIEEEKTEELIVSKDGINMGLFSPDFISKELFDYLCTNYRWFNWIAVIKRKKNIQDSSPLLLYILGGLLSIFIITLFIINTLSPVNLSLFSGLLISICVGAIFFFKVNMMKKTFFSIAFNDRKSIVNKISKGSLQINDIFEKFKIEFPGQYTCAFNAHIDCFLQAIRREGKHTYISSTLIDTYKIIGYQGANLSLLNVPSHVEIFNNHEKVTPHMFNSENKISYKIRYTFQSPELFDYNGEIDLMNSVKLNNVKL